MSQPYVGEIRMFAGNFAPNGWEFCNGQLLSIAENEVLFQLIGTTYGGDGVNTYALPNLQSRVPIHQGNNSFATYVIGQQAGEENVTLTTQQIPAHTHQASCSSGPANQTSPTGNFWSYSTKELLYSATENGSMNPADISSVGGSQPHNNIQPYLAISFIISLFGIFPSQN
jgi:microcystin-dependent protein